MFRSRGHPLHARVTLDAFDGALLASSVQLSARLFLWYNVLQLRSLFTR